MTPKQFAEMEYPHDSCVPARQVVIDTLEIFKGFAEWVVENEWNYLSEVKEWWKLKFGATVYITTDQLLSEYLDTLKPKEGK